MEHFGGTEFLRLLGGEGGEVVLGGGEEVVLAGGEERLVARGRLVGLEDTEEKGRNVSLRFLVKRVWKELVVGCESGGEGLLLGEVEVEG